MHDPKYVRMIAFYTVVSEDGDSNHKEIPFRDCTEEDFAKFNPIEDENLI